MTDPEVVDAELVHDDPPATQALTTRPALAVTPSVQAGELVARLDVIREAMHTAMTADVDYGVIPGTGSKPTLLKPGAEKLGVLFQLDVQLENVKTWDGDHLTVESKATVYHAPTGARLGFGEGLCSTRERKYGKRKQDRACPVCGAAAIIKGREEYGGGWVCFKKRDGCGAKYPDGDRAIEGQEVGTIENPDLPDTWNTVVKMAEKRARVDAVLAVTGASALFTQDAEDQPHEPHQTHPQAPAGEVSPWTSAIMDVQRLVRLHRVKTAQLRLVIRDAGIQVADDANVLDTVLQLTLAQATAVARRLEQGAVPTGESDVPNDDPGGA